MPDKLENRFGCFPKIAAENCYAGRLLDGKSGVQWKAGTVRKLEAMVPERERA